VALGRALMTVGGKADIVDAELVSQELSKIPPHALRILAENKTQVVVCRGSVTDHLASLRGVKPRGWPPGSSWDSVPGLHSPDRNEVVIATIGHGTPAGRRVPQTGEGHGSKSLVVHETFHAIDHGKSAGSPRSSAAEFNAARNADKPTLSAYESQPGAAGQEESYAETAARYYGADTTDATQHPNLHKYWHSDPSSEWRRS
jgi:hypothetical protein